jgi:hypothetical protein
MNIWVAGAAVLALLTGASAATINVSTSNTTAWEVDVPSLSIANATALSGYTIGDISPFPEGNGSGYDGFWVASYTFTLPADATGVSLDFSGLNADDRGVLELNGTIIGDAGGAAPGDGYMTLTDGGTNQPFVFGGSSAEEGVVTTGFDLGTTNTLEVIVNNTQTGIYGSLTGGGYTQAGLTGTLTYSTSATPEPQSWFLIVGILVLLACVRRRLRSSDRISIG